MIKQGGGKEGGESTLLLFAFEREGDDGEKKVTFNNGNPALDTLTGGGGKGKKREPACKSGNTVLSELWG